jgi:hypothetical protein
LLEIFDFGSFAWDTERRPNPASRGLALLSSFVQRTVARQACALRKSHVSSFNVIEILDHEIWLLFIDILALHSAGSPRP